MIVVYRHLGKPRAAILKSTSGTICVELVKKLQDSGARFTEVPVHHYHRVYGRSQFFNFPRIWRTGTQLLGLWWELAVQRRHLRAGRRHPVVKRET